MTGRERMAAALRGQEVDRFPVWLKMANRTWQGLQPEPCRSMPALDLLRAAGCDLVAGCSLPAEALACVRPHATESVAVANGRRVTAIQTPDRTLVGEERIDPVTQTAHPSKYAAATLPDLASLRWYYRDTQYTVDPARTGPGQARQRELAALDAYTTDGVGPSPLMHLMQHLCGPEACVYHLVDAPALFHELLELMHQDRLRYLRAVLPHCPADTFWLTENTSTTLISPAMFRDLCVPHLAEYGRLVLDHGLVPVHHMCGKLNAILEMIDALPALANEAYTTPPVGDASLAEGRRRMPSKALIGGTNAALWLQPVEAIVRAVAADLAACPDRRRIFLTSAGVLPPSVSFAKAKAAVAAFRQL